MVVRVGSLGRWGRNRVRSNSGASVPDVLSYTAPDFKAGNTMVPLSEFSFGLPYDLTMGSVAATLATDWGFTYNLEDNPDWSDATTPNPAKWDTPGQHVYEKIAFANAHPGAFTLATKTRALLSHGSVAITEELFYPGGSGYSYVTPNGLLQSLNGEFVIPAMTFRILGNIAAGAFLQSPTTNTIVRSSGRAMLKPDFSLYDTFGTAAYVAAEAQLISEINNRLTGGNYVSVVVNGAEYQPYALASSTTSIWSKNHAYSIGDVVRTPSLWAGSTVYGVGARVHVSGTSIDVGYVCTTGGTSAASGGPSGTGTGIVDGSCVWDYDASQPSRIYICVTAGTSANTTGAGPMTTSADITDGSAHWEYCADSVGGTSLYWMADSDTHSMLATALAQPNTDPGNTAYLDSLLLARQTTEASVYAAHKSAGVDHYIYYGAGDFSEGVLGSSRSDGRRQRSIYGTVYPYAVTPVVTTDYPGWEFYRGYRTSFTELQTTSGGFRGYTLPEQVLNATAQNIEGGTPLMYPFVAGVWNGSAAALLDDLYMGFMKFVYTCGCIGCVPGYYSVGPNNGTWVIGDGACDQVRQYCTIGHVHATFSHLENYIRSGTLLAGDYDAWSLGYSSHILSKNVYTSSNGFIHSSYEFAHNDTQQWYSKVIARKLNASNDWLICAWRCYDGPDATLSVTIAGHALSVNARRGGTLYHMNNSGTLTMLDPLSMDPSRSIASILAGL